MNISINNKIYKLEYNFEAAHDKKCVDICWNYFSGAYMMKGTALNELENSETMSKIATIDKMIESMADLPERVLYLFYAGLLENHSNEVQSSSDARALYKQFCKENPDDEKATDFGMFEAIKEEMEAEGFFKRIGLTRFMEQMNQPVQKRQIKTPRDRVKKANPSAN